VGVFSEHSVVWIRQTLAITCSFGAEVIYIRSVCLVPRFPFPRFPPMHFRPCHALYSHVFSRPQTRIRSLSFSAQFF